MNLTRRTLLTTTTLAAIGAYAGTGAATTAHAAASDGEAAAAAFRAKWEGVAIDVDGYYGAQCWDLAAQYALDNGLPAIATGDGAAAGIYELYESNGNAAYYDRYANSESDPDSIPLPGDVIVWNRNMGGGYGHVAVVLAAEWYPITVIQQNPGAANVHTYPNYDNVLGWLRPQKFA